MGFSIGLVGLPNAGKSTIFNAISKTKAQTANYAFTTVDPNKSIVSVPDERLEKIVSVIKPLKHTYGVLECIDIAGLVKGAGKGEGLGNKFLEHIRQVDCIAHVIRCFRDENIPSETGKIDPVKDLELIETELIMADLEISSKRLTRASKALRTGDKTLSSECKLLERIKGTLEQGKPFLERLNKDEDGSIVKELNLLSSKPSIYIANIKEGQEKELIDRLSEVIEQRGSNIIVFDGLIESESQDLSVEDKKEMLIEYGYGETGLNSLLKEGYRTLNLITYYTIKGEETRAWVLKKGQSALEAAAKIHSDIAMGFIKAEIIHYKDFEKMGSADEVKKAGLMEIAGKDYTVLDGDLILFKFM